jgi:hypothetical protein
MRIWFAALNPCHAPNLSNWHILAGIHHTQAALCLWSGVLVDLHVEQPPILEDVRIDSSESKLAVYGAGQYGSDHVDGLSKHY